jgi:LysR family transcriptional regulator, glycine cleavage system transcriptional activator
MRPVGTDQIRSGRIAAIRRRADPRRSAGLVACDAHPHGGGEDWETWCNHSQTDASSARKFVVSSAQLALEAAVDGLGLAIGRLPIIDDDIAAGRLAIAADHVVPVMSGYWLVKPPGLETRREVVAFRNWLLKEMSQLRWNGNAERRVTLHSA